MSALSKLAARYDLSAGAAEQLRILVDCAAGDLEAPTTVTGPEAIVRDHLADSLVALELDLVHRSSVIADVGAGAGFPGLPLAIALPAARVHLVESVRRKCAYMERVAEMAAVPNAAVVNARAEEWTAGVEACDLVTARALAPLGVVAEYAAPLLRIGGHLLAWRGRRDPEDEALAALAAAQLGLELLPPVAVTPYPGALHRHLHPLLKTEPTPERFPRRAGMARKRPLGRRSA